MHLIRCLSLIECSYHFNIVSKHIPGKQNDLADALSRNRLSLFRSQYPQALRDPSDVAVDSTSNPTTMQVRIKSSKTNPFRKGIDLYVGAYRQCSMPRRSYVVLQVSSRGNRESPLPIQGWKAPYKGALRIQSARWPIRRRHRRDSIRRSQF